MRMPAELEMLDPTRILDLDVREDLRAGREPFQRIMHARQALADDGVLRLRAIFEPRPLYGVLGREGFSYWTERLADDDWRVWFYRVGGTAPIAGPAITGQVEVPGAAAAHAAAAHARPAAPAPRPRSGGPSLPTCGSPKPEPSDVTVLDVRGLEPPEPMQRTLEALEAMPRGRTLVQVNSRVPRFLLPELEQRGFRYIIHEEQPEVVRVFIRHAEALPVLDVRAIAPREKHPTIFATFDALEAGACFVLLNDHDPVPLRYQFMAERPNAFTWEYLEQGPEIWRVRIGKG